MKRTLTVYLGTSWCRKSIIKMILYVGVEILATYTTLRRTYKTPGRIN